MFEFFSTEYHFYTRNTRIGLISGFLVFDSQNRFLRYIKPIKSCFYYFLLNVISTRVIPESDKNRIFQFLTLRIIFYAIYNLENHVCIIFLLNGISTHV